MYTIVVELNGFPVGSVTAGQVDDDFLLSRATLSAVEKAVADLLAVGLVQWARIEVLVLCPEHTSEAYSLRVKTLPSDD